jgi:hypothetical protein
MPPSTGHEPPGRDIIVWLSSRHRLKNAQAAEPSAVVQWGGPSDIHKAELAQWQAQS